MNDLHRSAEQSERNARRLRQYRALLEINRIRAAIGLPPTVPPIKLEVMK